MKHFPIENQIFKRPQAIIPFRDSPKITSINNPPANNLINSNISPLLYTPKIKPKEIGKLPPQLAFKKIPHLPMINKLTPKKEPKGHSDEFLKKPIRTNSSRNYPLDETNKKKESISFYCSNLENSEDQQSNTTSKFSQEPFKKKSPTHNLETPSKDKYPKNLIDKAMKATILGKKTVNQVNADLKEMKFGKKLSMLKQYFKSLAGGSDFKANLPNNTDNKFSTKQKRNLINANSSIEKNNTQKNVNGDKAFTRRKRFLTPTQKKKIKTSEDINKTNGCIQNTDVKKNIKLTREHPIPTQQKKLSLIDYTNFQKNLGSPNKKLSIVEISSFLNSEELLKIKFKEKLQNNIWKISNETSTNDEMNSLMKKTSDFSIQQLSKPMVIVKNIRSESIPNLLTEEMEEKESGKIKNNKKTILSPSLEIDVDHFLSQGTNLSPKILSNNEISDVIQKLSSSKKIKKGENFQENPTFLYQDFFDFNKSQEKLITLTPRNPYLGNDSRDLEEILNNYDSKKEHSPKFDSGSKTIKPLFNFYNNSKFASPLMKSSHQRIDFEGFSNVESCEKINPIDDFCDDI